MGGGNEAALAALPQAPPAVREVLGLLETGQLERATGEQAHRACRPLQPWRPLAGQCPALLCLIVAAAGSSSSSGSLRHAAGALLASSLRSPAPSTHTPGSGAPAELCRLFPGLRPPLERELRAAEELAASSPQDWSLPPRATRHLAGWAAQGVLARFRVSAQGSANAQPRPGWRECMVARTSAAAAVCSALPTYPPAPPPAALSPPAPQAFMLRPVDDQGDAAQTQLSERCSEKERKQALRCVGAAACWHCAITAPADVSRIQHVVTCSGPRRVLPAVCRLLAAGAWCAGLAAFRPCLAQGAAAAGACGTRLLLMAFLGGSGCQEAHLL